MYRIILASLLTLTSYQATAGQPAPTINLPGLQGSVQSEAFKGKVMYVDFWASWCTPCVQSFPWLNSMQSRYKKLGLEIVAINLDQEATAANDFLQKVPAQFTVAFDPAGKTAEQFHVQGMPSSYLIDRHGNVRASHTGFRLEDRAKLELAISQLLQEK
jgi:cytochrome c biogenesis protein CcmG, thiol:disulfide interchange protein DsbE